MKVGRFGRITVEQARAVAKRLAGEVALNGDPAQERKVRRKTCTLDELLDAYIKEHLTKICSDQAVRSAKRVREQIKKGLGGKLVTDLATDDGLVAVQRFLSGFNTCSRVSAQTFVPTKLSLIRNKRKS